MVHKFCVPMKLLPGVSGTNLVESLRPLIGSINFGILDYHVTNAAYDIDLDAVRFEMEPTVESAERQSAFLAKK